MRTTKFGILFGWSLLLVALILVPLLPYPTDYVALTVAAIVIAPLLGPKQMKPMAELVEENPAYWRRFALPYYLAVMVGMLYCAFFQRESIGFLIEPGIGMVLLLGALLGPFVPFVFQYERERYRKAL